MRRLGGWRWQPYASPLGGSRGWRTIPSSALAACPTQESSTHTKGCKCKASLNSPRVWEREKPSQAGVSNLRSEEEEEALRWAV